MVPNLHRLTLHNTATKWKLTPYHQLRALNRILHEKGLNMEYQETLTEVVSQVYNSCVCGGCILNIEGNGTRRNTLSAIVHFFILKQIIYLWISPTLGNHFCLILWCV